MRLLLVTSRFPFGPKESFLTQEIEELMRRFDVMIAPARPTAEPVAVARMEPAAVRFPLMHPRVLARAAAEVLRNPLRATATFVTVVRSPRALHARLKNAAMFPTALALAGLARKRRIDHVHAYWLSGPATIAYVVARMNGITWSATGHRYDLVDFNVRTVGKPHAGFLSSARFVRTISQQGAAQLARAFQRAVISMHVIPLGVRLAAPAPRTTARCLRLICAANLEPVKGHRDLLRALALASTRCDVHLTIAGDGTLRHELPALVRELGLERRVTFAGAVAHERLLNALSAGEYDGAILTSIDQGPEQREGIPVFLMESMAAGLPVIATRSGAVGELADDDVALVCAPGDINAIAESIVRLAADANVRERLGECARARIARNFESSASAARLASLIRGDAA